LTMANRKLGMVESGVFTFKALSLWQPWASMIADADSVNAAWSRDLDARRLIDAAGVYLPGPKRIETRYWQTGYRGPVILCATKTPRIPQLPTGCALAVARLADCRRMKRADETLACCQYADDLYAWVLDGVRAIEPPFAACGRQGLFDLRLPADLVHRYGLANFSDTD